ncbi:hypothetical protein MLD38_010296 [Melastoma candidum]|uniref:Uncharacterized protein n=1 Tax=Melastoma candidum TaxID=119954 RepID=A0ACB9R0G1_9MYRT|nr:hypothetical protein MLD38_010296 [Melastoma candidum]
MGHSQKNPISQFLQVLLLMFMYGIQGCLTLNEEGLALLRFRARVETDPYGVFDSWSPDDHDPCNWIGVRCMNGHVHMLVLSDQSVKGVLSSEIGSLVHLKSLVLKGNDFFGEIPREFGNLKEIELLDLRENNLGGAVPEELGRLFSLKRLLLCGNKFQGNIPKEVERLSFLSELQFDENLTLGGESSSSCLNRKLSYCIWQSSSKPIYGVDVLIPPIKGTISHYLNTFPFSRFWKVTGDADDDADDGCTDAECLTMPKIVQKMSTSSNSARRRLVEQSSNLAADPVDLGSLPSRIPSVLITRSSGSFPAVPRANFGNSNALPMPPTPSQGGSGSILPRQDPATYPMNWWKFAVIIPGILIMTVIIIVMITLCRKQGVRTIGPWKTGLSGQLQKAFVTGVPKLQRFELETACEDFSNIISTDEGCIIYKGTLSSGVEIAVNATAVSSFKEWSSSAEKAYRRKVAMLSRVNHKNFVNLIGYCEENDPFTRMMVFEYAPNGQLFEHLHETKDVEHPDWTTRMRIVMGIAYCLRYMHHDLKPPVPHSNLNSSSIYLTDDFAAKVAETSFDAQSPSRTNFNDDGSESAELLSGDDVESNVYNFGIILLEIITGRHPYTEEQGPLIDWASEYLNGKRSVLEMVDPTVKLNKEEEVEAICEVIRQCIHPEPMQRPTMEQVVSRLRQVIQITPDQATPRLSPLWWAELEILSVEAN